MERQWLLDSPLDIKEPLARALLQIRAVEIRPDDPFTWSSGWKSPIYCDMRLTLSYPGVRNLIASGLESVIRERYPGVDVVVGAATGGIAHAAIVADRLHLPTAYVRSGAKEHGKQRRVEGRIQPGNTAIVVEDTLSTGASAYDVVTALQTVGMEVLAVCAVFSYDFDQARGRAQQANVPAYRLLDYPTLIAAAVRDEYVTESQLQRLLAWRSAPDRYGS